MSEQSNITIYYDDQLPDVMNKINKELLQLGVQIQNDCAPHDGFEVFYLERSDDNLQNPKARNQEDQEQVLGD